MIVFTKNNPDGCELLSLRPISPGAPKSRACLRTPDGRELTAFVAAGAIHGLFEQRAMPDGTERELMANYQRHLYATTADGGETVVLLTQAEHDQLEAGELELPGA